MQTNARDYQYIDTQQGLEKLCEQLSHQPVLALDTEFIRTNTFYPNAGLIQFADTLGCYLLDPLAIDDFQPLRELLRNDAIVYVIHSCREDLEVLEYLLGCVPAQIFDTQIAATLAGIDFSMGFQRLVEYLLEVELSKTNQRSNWLQRPLSDEQLRYAADDVYYALKIYPLLRDSLASKQRLTWLQSDCETLLRPVDEQAAIRNYWQDVKSAWKLSPRSLQALQYLCEWREITARQKNKPRSFIIPDADLLKIAKQLPKDEADLHSIDGLSLGYLRRYADVLLSSVEQALLVAEADLPVALPAPLPSRIKPVLKRFKAKVLQLAELQNIPPQSLLNKKEFEWIMRSGMETGEYSFSPAVSAWRRQLLADVLDETLQGEIIL